MNIYKSNRLIRVFLFVLGFALLPISASYGQVWYTNYTAALKQAEESGQPIFVVFESQNYFNTCRNL
jgi:hypothetical protein